LSSILIFIFIKKCWHNQANYHQKQNNATTTRNVLNDEKAVTSHEMSLGIPRLLVPAKPLGVRISMEGQLPHHLWYDLILSFVSYDKTLMLVCPSPAVKPISL
jgi:hypothetical protein